MHLLFLIIFLNLLFVDSKKCNKGKKYNGQVQDFILDKKICVNCYVGYKFFTTQHRDNTPLHMDPRTPMISEVIFANVTMNYNVTTHNVKETRSCTIQSIYSLDDYDKSIETFNEIYHIGSYMKICVRNNGDCYWKP